MDFSGSVLQPKYPWQDLSIFEGFIADQKIQLQPLKDFFNFLFLLAMQETSAMADRIRVGWFISYFQVDRGALFKWRDEQFQMTVALDRNGKILEKFSYDKKSLNRAQKSGQIQFPSEEEIKLKSKRFWVVPFLWEGEVKEYLYLDCLSDTLNHIHPELLKACYWMSQQYLQHRNFPDTQVKTRPLERKHFKYSYEKIIGRSPAICRIFETLDKISEAEHLPVLILGKSGTGKELVAQVIHDNSPRRGKPYIAENCAAIPETLLESELFGYVPGAFTGADKVKKGLFEMAHTGTLFLDEVGDMSLEMQKKLLRALQEGEIRPVGASTTQKVDVRIIAATNRDLKTMIQEGLFREDLYFRLSALIIYLPDLAERKNDIEELLEFFLEKIAKDLGQPKKMLDPALKARLLQYSWPGNVRELENEVKRMVALGEQVLTLDILSPQIRNALEIDPVSNSGNRR
ncbi:MAG: sigma 54-interacting transcriptional regulator [Planctomycetota bacterium]